MPDPGPDTFPQEEVFEDKLSFPRRSTAGATHYLARIRPEWRCRPLAEFLGNSPKVLGLVLRNRGNGDLKCSAKEHVCRMLNPCDAITAGSRSARSFIAISGCGSVRPIASVHISAASTI